MLTPLTEIVRAAGRLALESYGRLRADDIAFKSETDLVTPIDRAVEEFLHRELGRAFPGAAFLGEEGTGGRADRSAPRCFVVDPIDGTTSFVHRLPHWSVSVAYKEHGQTLAGVVYAPVLDDLYTATAGGGAWHNGAPIAVSCCGQLIHALGATGFACVRARLQPDSLPIFNAAIYQIRGIRRFGSAAIDLSLVAEGRLDLYWEINIKPWDIAAGTLILREAGGRVTDLEGGDASETRHEILATNGHLHEAFLELVRQARGVPPTP